MSEGKEESGSWYLGITYLIKSGELRSVWERIEFPLCAVEKKEAIAKAKEMLNNNKKLKRAGRQFELRGELVQRIPIKL